MAHPISRTATSGVFAVVAVIVPVALPATRKALVGEACPANSKEGLLTN